MVQEGVSLTYGLSNRTTVGGLKWLWTA